MPCAGVPLGMTMIPAKLAEVGYRSHMLGKWHVGMATPAHTPIGRGFESSLHYFDSGNNYYNQTTWNPPVLQLAIDVRSTAADPLGPLGPSEC